MTTKLGYTLRTDYIISHQDDEIDERHTQYKKKIKTYAENRNTKHHCLAPSNYILLQKNQNKKTQQLMNLNFSLSIE